MLLRGWHWRLEQECFTGRLAAICNACDQAPDCMLDELRLVARGDAHTDRGVGVG